MRHDNRVPSRPVALLCLALMSGALGCIDAIGPDGRLGLKIEALGDLNGVGEPGKEVKSLPAVRVTEKETGDPVAGKLFVFTSRAPDGRMESKRFSTDANGVAAVPSWRLGSDVGLYSMDVSTDGWGPAKYSVVIPGRIVAIYDLVSINDQPLIHYPWVTEDHVILYESGWFNRFRNAPVESFVHAPGISGTYWRTGPDQLSLDFGCPVVFSHQCVPWVVQAFEGGSTLTTVEEGITTLFLVSRYVLREWTDLQ